MKIFFSFKDMKNHHPMRIRAIMTVEDEMMESQFCVCLFFPFLDCSFPFFPSQTYSDPM